MSQRNVVKEFNRVIDEANNSNIIPQLIGFSKTSNIFDVTFRES